MKRILSSDKMQQDILDLVHLHSEVETYRHKDVIYEYYNVPEELWSLLCDNFLKKRKKILRLMIGGFLLGRNIYIKANRKLGRNKLILHEIGHKEGLGHTWKPAIMNPSWAFRWFKKINL